MNTHVRIYVCTYSHPTHSLTHPPSLSLTPTHDVFFFLISNLISATKKEESTPRTTSAHLPISRPHHVHHLSASQELSLSLDNRDLQNPSRSKTSWSCGCQHQSLQAQSFIVLSVRHLTSEKCKMFKVTEGRKHYYLRCGSWEEEERWSPASKTRRA